jgi:hypothetical protein
MRLRFGRRLSRILAGVVVALLAVGAFFARGPIGLGNGPLSFGSFTATGIPDPHGMPVGLVVSVVNGGRAAAVINGITLVGGGNDYPVPRLTDVYGVLDAGCSKLGLLAGPGSQAIAGRCVTGHFSLGGMAIPPSRTVLDRVTGELVPVSSFGLVAVAAPPAPGRCWTIKAIAIHYRVGIRHFTATTPEAGASCGAGVSNLDLTNALNSIGR